MININLTSTKDESIQHATIKEYLIKTLREIGSKNDFCDYGDLSWRTNRGGPTYGIREEYPFFESAGNQAIDEGIGVDCDCSDEELWNCLKSEKEPIKYIADIIIQHKGVVLHAIEIVKCSPPSQEKIDFYLENGVDLVAISLTGELSVVYILMIS